MSSYAHVLVVLQVTPRRPLELEVWARSGQCGEGSRTRARLESPKEAFIHFSLPCQTQESTHNPFPYPSRLSC